MRTRCQLDTATPSVASHARSICVWVKPTVPSHPHCHRTVSDAQPRVTLHPHCKLLPQHGRAWHWAVSLLREAEPQGVVQARAVTRLLNHTAVPQNERLGRLPNKQCRRALCIRVPIAGPLVVWASMCLVRAVALIAPATSRGFAWHRMFVGHRSLKRCWTVRKDWPLGAPHLCCRIDGWLDALALTIAITLLLTLHGTHWFEQLVQLARTVFDCL
mmetsp:Transcript_18174/g.30377  ORF Transcript_18174/g.30377 Transcript_18174/m.30377 type:complete len:216 (+) Transcript_18174:335-982(+)